MGRRQGFFCFLALGFSLILLSACAAPAPIGAPSSRPAAETLAVEKEGATVLQPTSTYVGEELSGQLVTLPTAVAANTQASAPSAAQPTYSPTKANMEMSPLPTSSPAPTLAAPVLSQPTATLTAITPIEPAGAENHHIQVEWPLEIRMGESDIVRLTLLPVSQGYDLVTEYPEHQTYTQTITIRPVNGYELFAVARLDGVGFGIAPAGEQAQYLPPGEALSWRWSLTPSQPGRQRLSITLTLRWMPIAGSTNPVREVTVFSRSLDVRVLSFFGLTQAQAFLTGIFTLLLGGSLSLFAIVIRPRPPRATTGFELQPPNLALAIELPANLHLGAPETTLLKALFQRYARLVVQQEFLSGYSGARTFLALPIRADGRADAYTITKIGERQTMQREYHNYENFVKDTLPPITARIQRPPVSSVTAKSSHLAALQYTFIGEPGRPPVSLRQALLSNPDPGLIFKLLETFGPNWWLQHRPFTFRLAAEYDRVLPTHLVIEPAAGKGRVLDARQSPVDLDVHIGERVILRNFAQADLRQDGVSYSAQGPAAPGQPPLRVRWLSARPPEGATGRVIATRQELLASFVEGCDLLGLPNPLQAIPDLLNVTLHASQSIIHGDLNLENILVGPGGMLWLIDFAQTREGHTLFDFAHLEAEVIGHIIAPKVEQPADYLAILRGKGQPQFHEFGALLGAIHETASRCLFNPAEPREYKLALTLICLGALKFNNLSPYARHLLYLTAAEFLQETLQ